jgi:hypothetical protein
MLCQCQQYRLRGAWVRLTMPPGIIGRTGKCDSKPALVPSGLAGQVYTPGAMPSVMTAGHFANFGGLFERLPDAVADVAVAELGGDGEACGIQIDLNALAANVSRATDRTLLLGLSGYSSISTVSASRPASLMVNS